MNKIKIFLFTHDKKNGKYLGEKQLIYNGIIKNKKTEIVNKISKCKYIFLDFRDINKLTVIFLRKHRLFRKTIIIDFRDNPNEIFNLPVLKYFKRSVVNKNKLKFVNYNKKIIPISYCVKQEIINSPKFDNIDYENRNIDLSIFFKINNKKENRMNVTKFIKNNFKDLKKHVGVIGENGKVGRNTIQDKYYDKMLNSKIIVTCNPHNWEGDYRLFEALATGALVFVDKMLTPKKNKFINGEHLIYYDMKNLNELKDKILYYLENETERIRIAKNGNEFVKKFHKPSDRINEIISCLS